MCRPASRWRQTTCRGFHDEGLQGSDRRSDRRKTSSRAWRESANRPQRLRRRLRSLTRRGNRSGERAARNHRTSARFDVQRESICRRARCCPKRACRRTNSVLVNFRRTMADELSIHIYPSDCDTAGRDAQCHTECATNCASRFTVGASTEETAAIERTQAIMEGSGRESHPRQRLVEFVTVLAGFPASGRPGLSSPSKPLSV